MSSKIRKDFLDFSRDKTVLDFFDWWWRVYDCVDNKVCVNRSNDIDRVFKSLEKIEIL